MTLPAELAEITVLGVPVVFPPGATGFTGRLNELFSRCRTGEPLHDEIRFDPDHMPRSLRATVDEVQRLVVPRAARAALVLHGASVALDSRTAAVLLGASCSGRTTGVLELAARGCAYLADALVAIDDAGSVMPYPGPIRLPDEAAEVDESGLASPDELAMPSAVGPPLEPLLLMLDRVPDHEGPPRIRQVDGPEAVQLLARVVANPLEQEAPLTRICRLLEQAGPLYMLTFSQFTSVVDLVGDLAARKQSSTAGLRWARTGTAREFQNRLAWALRDGRIRHAPYLEAVEVEGDNVVLIGGEPVRVTGIGLVLWELAGRAPHLDELTGDVVAVVGPHPDADRLVEEAVRALCGVGVLGFGRPEHVHSFWSWDDQARRRMQDGAAS